MSYFNSKSSIKRKIFLARQNPCLQMQFMIYLQTYIQIILIDFPLLQYIHISPVMRKVSYLYNQAITNYHFSKEHPMKTKRIKMAHSLIQSYDLSQHLLMFQSKQASKDQLNLFHDPHYVDYLQKWVTNRKEDPMLHAKEQQKRRIRDDNKLRSLFKINQSFDCPGFEGLYHFCQLAAGGSVDAADIVLTGISDVAINWAGGYHHAKKTQASGFCYINDIVICILELLKVYPRVLYLDIDVHHGDGVQEAFYNTNRVMTVSFHEFDEDFFPGTGPLTSVGEGVGRYYSVNVPLKKGITDDIYIDLFKKVMDTCMGSYRPDALVIQCGADSLSKDRLGHLSLTIKGHATCVDYMLKFGLPTVILGGGGYTIENVSRCWAYETATILGLEIDKQIPQKDQFYHLYEHDNHCLLFDIDKRPNENSPEYLNNIVQTIGENMREAEIRPSVAFHSVPKKYLPEEEMDWKMVAENEDSMTDSLCEEVFKKIE